MKKTTIKCDYCATMRNVLSCDDVPEGVEAHIDEPAAIEDRSSATRHARKCLGLALWIELEKRTLRFDDALRAISFCSGCVFFDGESKTPPQFPNQHHFATVVPVSLGTGPSVVSQAPHASVSSPPPTFSHTVVDFFKQLLTKESLTTNGAGLYEDAPPRSVRFMGQAGLQAPIKKESSGRRGKRWRG